MIVHTRDMTQAEIEAVIVEKQLAPAKAMVGALDMVFKALETPGEDDE